MKQTGDHKPCPIKLTEKQRRATRGPWRRFLTCLLFHVSLSLRGVHPFLSLHLSDATSNQIYRQNLRRNSRWFSQDCSWSNDLPFSLCVKIPAAAEMCESLTPCAVLAPAHHNLAGALFVIVQQRVLICGGYNWRCHGNSHICRLILMLGANKITECFCALKLKTISTNYGYTVRTH
jgi:hypothetical protein